MQASHCKDELAARKPTLAPRNLMSRLRPQSRSFESPTACSYASVPGPAILDEAPGAMVVEAIGHHDASEEFRALVTELSLDPCSQWRAVTDRQIAAVHAVRQNGLRV